MGVAPLYAPHVGQMAGLLAEPDPLLVVPEPDDGWMESILAAIREDGGAPAEVRIPAEVRAAVSAVEAIDAAGRWERGAPGSLVQIAGHTPIVGFLGQHMGAVKSGAGLLWIRGSGADIADAAVLGALKALCERIRRHGSGWRILLSGAEASLPPSLAHAGRIVALERLRRRGGSAAMCEMRSFVGNVLGRAGAGADGDLTDFACERLQGLEASSMCRILERAVHRAKLPEQQDVRMRIREERDALLRAGVLEVREFDAEKKLREMGGLHVLRGWLDDVGFLFQDWRERDEQSKHVGELLPKGVLLVGLPGCGKSLAAEVAAAKLKLPLLQLHMGRLMGRYLGESEANLERALAGARAAAPCVLWIDEIEKAVGGLGSEGGGGTGGRMLGTLLGWMQDNTAGVFVVGTANKLDAVPPELLRRGRFDEHFRVGLPNEGERKEILLGAIDRRDTESGAADREKLATAIAKKTNEFSGADLKAFVSEAARRAWLTEWRCLLLEKDFPNVGEDFRPQAHQFKAQYAAMKKQTDELGFRDASSPEGQVPGVRKRGEKPKSTLPKELSQLAFGGETWEVEWSAGGLDQRLVVETADGLRSAELRLGDAVVATYRVTRGTAGTKAAVVLSRASASSSGPETLALVSAAGGGMDIVVVHSGAQSNHAAKMGPMAPAEGSTVFSGRGQHHVILRDAGAHKMQALEAVRQVTGLGVAHSQTVVETAPRVVKISVSQEAAIATQQRLVQAGCSADIFVLPAPPERCSHCSTKTRYNLSMIGSRWLCVACKSVP